MSNFVKLAVGCSVVTAAALLVVHRRVIAAYINGEPMPEAPEWHKKCFKHLADPDEIEE